MNTLRVKIAVLMVIVIVSVVGSLTLVAVLICSVRRSASIRWPGGAAGRVRWLHVAEEGSAGGHRLVPEPAVGSRA